MGWGLEVDWRPIKAVLGHLQFPVLTPTFSKDEFLNSCFQSSVLWPKQVSAFGKKKKNFSCDIPQWLQAISAYNISAHDHLGS